MQNLTPRQVQVLNTITEFRNSHGYSPTIGELANRMGISRTTAFEHIEQLRKKELISAPIGKARSLATTSKTRKLLEQIRDSGLAASSFAKVSEDKRDTQQEEGIPFVGTIAAGLPVEAIENCQCISLETVFGNKEDTFALEVRGDSMTGENINEGDYVICKKTTSASDGQLVVAIVDDNNATLKRFYKEGNQVRLQPANEAYEPIYSDNCRIEGVVIGLVRKL